MITFVTGVKDPLIGLGFGQLQLNFTLAEWKAFRTAVERHDRIGTQRLFDHIEQTGELSLLDCFVLYQSVEPLNTTWIDDQVPGIARFVDFLRQCMRKNATGLRTVVRDV
jgi:hypothetical protein